MTEAEWLRCDDPKKMLGFLAGRNGPGVRKSHLFACACVRRIWHLLKDARLRLAVEMGEQLADGLIAAGQVEEAWDAWDAGDGAFFMAEAEEVATLAATGIAPHLFFADAQRYALLAATDIGDAPVDSAPPAVAAELKAQAHLLRCIAGSPFCPVALAVTWRTAAVVPIARAAYDERLPSGELDSERLAIIADALEEAGCTDAAILGHLRGPGPHVRGCWVVDLVLGKQ